MAFFLLALSTANLSGMGSVKVCYGINLQGGIQLHDG
jgi:hypothetical protein